MPFLKRIFEYYMEVKVFSAGITSNWNITNSTIFPKQITNKKSEFNTPEIKKTTEDDSSRKNLRQLIAGLAKEGPTDYKIVNGKKVFCDTAKDKVNGFLQLAGTSIDTELEAIKNKPKYRYKEVSSKIRAAKTSASASQALIAAKRNVSEIKRQLRFSTEDSDELQIALSHAKRMEMTARKKKKHLEIEEMIENAKKFDFKTEEENASGFSEQEIRSTIIENAEDKIEEMEDDVLDELSSMLEDFGEEALKQLEDSMEIIESIEVIDPHMSDEEFKKLKTKHRASEEKSLVKADMEYLKDMVKLMESDFVSDTCFDVSV